LGYEIIDSYRSRSAVEKRVHQLNAQFGREARNVQKFGEETCRNN